MAKKTPKKKVMITWCQAPDNSHDHRRVYQRISERVSILIRSYHEEQLKIKPEFIILNLIEFCLDKGVHFIFGGKGAAVS